MRALVTAALAILLPACTGDRVGEVSSTSGGAAGSSASGGTAGATTGGSGGSTDAGSDSGIPDGVRVLADHRDCPVDLEVVGGEVTWVDQGSIQNSAQDGVVATMPAAGCDDDAGSCISVLASAQDSPSAIEIRDQVVYFASIGNDSIWYLDGVSATPQPFATGQSFPRSIASDETALFWLNAGAFGAGDGEVRRAWLDEPGSNGFAIVPGQESPVALTLFDSTVFWTSYGFNDTDGRVMRADITGAGAAPIAVNQSAPRGIAATGAYVYWANSDDGTIMRSTPDGSVVEPLLQGLFTPSDVAVDTSGIYWVEAGTPNVYLDGSVKAAKLDGTGIVVLADNQRDPRRIVLSADHVFWINRGTQGLSPCSQHDGQIVRSPKPW